MMVDNTLGIAGRARRVEQANRLPFVGRPAAHIVGCALGQKRFVIERRQTRPLACIRPVVDVDDRGFAFAKRQSRLQRGRKFAVGEHEFGFAMVEDEGDRRGIEPVIQRVQHAAGERDGVMRFEHRRNVGRKDRDRLALLQTALDQRMRKAAHAGGKARIADARLPVHDRGLGRVDRRRTEQKAHRRKGREICCRLRQIGFEDRALWRHWNFLPCPIVGNRP